MSGSLCEEMLLISSDIVVFLPTVQLRALHSVFFLSYMLPLVLPEGVPVNLLQVTFELVLQ